MVAHTLSPRLLAIDCATDRMTVAVIAGERSYCADDEGGARTSQRLLPLVTEQLALASIALRDLDAVAFGRGPGAFTGLRSACSVAQGLALGIDCPVLSIDSLALVADDAREHQGGEFVWVAMDARMNEVYAGAYRFDAGVWHCVEAPALWTLPALAAAWRAAPPACVAGNAVAVFGERLSTGDALCVTTERDRPSALACTASIVRGTMQIAFCGPGI